MSITRKRGFNGRSRSNALDREASDDDYQDEEKDSLNNQTKRIRRLNYSSLGFKKIGSVFKDYEELCLQYLKENEEDGRRDDETHFYLGTCSFEIVDKEIDPKIDTSRNLAIRGRGLTKLESKVGRIRLMFQIDFKDQTTTGDEELDTDFVYNAILEGLVPHEVHMLMIRRYVNYVFNKLDFESNSISIDIYLSPKLMVSIENPSQFFKFKESKTVSFLFEHFYGIKAEKENMITDESDNDDPAKSDHLFDLIYHEHQKEAKKNSDARLDFGEHSYLLSILRPYQINAIKWMLKRETQVENHSAVHPLYRKVENKFGKVIYSHKFIGIFTDKMPTYVPSLPGGILADDMGLGKTLEVLGCILMNPRTEIPEYEIDTTKTTKKSNKYNFSCVCGNVPKGRNEDEKRAYQCVACGVWSHMDCVNYTGSQKEFICPLCCNQQKPILSGCTLIVTPSVISHQWNDEIKKHIKNKNLKVLLYKGCSYHGFLQPKYLASLDICITTYDVLSSELNHVWSIENLPNLRNAKRFMSIPSPMISVEWWRICLDEAQMVHKTNSKCAEMAGRLSAVNRWCVTGTPIGRSLSDLHGLFAFIREDPYFEERWFDSLLYEPYINQNKRPMIEALSKVLWRSTKRFVADQIDIPSQHERIHLLKFTPFEKHLYERILEMFRENRQSQFNSFLFETLDETQAIDQLDRETLSKISQPLVDLRLTCDHPQLILKKIAYLRNAHFKKENNRILTMEKSLEILSKKTKNECEEKYRLLIMSMNALAALKIIEEKYDDAIDMYRRALQSEKEYDDKLTIDKLQKIHALYNLNEVLTVYKNEKEDAELKAQFIEVEGAYMGVFNNTKLVCQEKFTKKTEAIAEIVQDEPELQTWWFSSLTVIEESKRTSHDFLDRLSLQISLNVVYNSGDNMPTDYSICGKTFTTYEGLKKIVYDEIEKFEINRETMLEQLQSFYNEIDRDLITSAKDCHLRPTQNGKKKAKCELCKADHALQSYAKHLFAKHDDILKRAGDEENEEEGDVVELDKREEEDTLNFDATNSKRSECDIEKFFKLIITFCRNNDNLQEMLQIGKKAVEMFELYREEFKLCRQFWKAAYHQISSYDELEMAKIRMRLREPSEPEDIKENYIIEPYHLQTYIVKTIGDKKIAEIELRKKLGQLLYLQNLEKSYALENNEENKDVCPICQCNLGVKWYMLACGHCYCTECTVKLSKAENLANKQVRCPLCREVSKGNEAYLVQAGGPTAQHDTTSPSTSKQASANENSDDEFENIKIKGKSNSTKVEGVVKCLMQILKDDKNAKCLVFSFWPVMLDLIHDSLKENLVEHRYLKENGTGQKNLLDFKHNENVTTLLIPYNFGANGLNLIEATHVLLVEPILNVSQEVQAIGRVHRIGQTKATFIHRFLIRETIEEILYKLLIGNSHYQRSDTESLSDTNRKAITVADLQNLFLNL